MYRDATTSLDEHDRAIGAILIGETLVAQCERLVEVIRDPQTHERWGAIRDIHDDYPEIWRHLDRAKSVLATRGVNTIGYDELRPHVRPSIAADSERPAGDRLQEIDPDALDDARRAIEELKLAVHGADWSAIDQRTQTLVETPRLRSSKFIAVAGVLLLCALVGISWFVAITPPTRHDRTEAMRQESQTVAADRQRKINNLSIAISERCDRLIARNLTTLLVMDGRDDDASRFVDVYLGRCGGDRYLERVTHRSRLASNDLTP